MGGPMSLKRNVFTIAPGAPFLETFVEALLAGDIVPTFSRQTPPLEMARARIYVPTRRAGRALVAAFARAFDKGATLLPRILPLGELEEREAEIFFSPQVEADDATLPQIDELERRLLLAKLIAAWSTAVGRAIVSVDDHGSFVHDESEPFLVAASLVGAYAMAGELAALIDEFIIEDVAADAIDKAIDDGSFDPYWSITTTFLRIAMRQWPAMLQERGNVDASTRRKRLIEAQIDRLAAGGDSGPVIALGSTGAQPTTARLLTTIAALEQGAVVLPGLDHDMDEATWALVAEGDGEPAFTHPQSTLKHLLGVMKLKRADVRELVRSGGKVAARRRLVSQAMAPAKATAAWRAFRAIEGENFAAALDGVTLVEAPDERTEALSLALSLREALETPGRTAALVTPDRGIARRVASELRRFDIEVDNSGGAPLASSSIGALARHIAAAGSEELDAVAIAALLSHPLVQLGRPREEMAALATLLEIGVLRVTPRREGGYRTCVDRARAAARDGHGHPAARRISEAQWRALETLLCDVEAAFAPFAELRGVGDLSRFAQAHRSTFEAVTKGARAGEDDAAIALFDLFDRLEGAAAPPGFDAKNYASLFDRIAFETVLRGPQRAHPRLKILGPLEARLIDADLMLLAGLDEGVWPPQSETGAFLNRSMRRQLNLSPPERRIGQSAHDFVMALGAADVVISRAVKRNGAPTVASRLLTRLQALAGEHFALCRARGERLVKIASALDQPAREDATSFARPAPRPALDLRPSKLSVTRIEVLRRDPYAIFAEYILRLAPLGALGAKIGPREQGVAIHAAIERFVALFPSGPLPDDALSNLEAFAREALSDFLSDRSFEIFAWPRIVEGLAHVYRFECARRELGAAILMERYGKWDIPLPDGAVFTLTARADRIEIDAQGSAFIFDYKTGAPPTLQQVLAGWSPQLTLEAAMIEAGAFKEVVAARLGGAAYVGLKAGGKTLWLEWPAVRFDDVVAQHRDELIGLLAQYRDPNTPYPSRPYVALATHAGEYDHLARVKEWSRSGGEEEA